MNENTEELDAFGEEKWSGVEEFDQSLTSGWKANLYAEGHLARQRFVWGGSDGAFLYDILILGRNSFNVWYFCSVNTWTLSGNHLLKSIIKLWTFLPYRNGTLAVSSELSYKKCFKHFDTIRAQKSKKWPKN